MSLLIQIEDWYGLHHGFSLELKPGFTALVGPNGAGKTTLLTQIEEFAKQSGIRVWKYSNLQDGGAAARSGYTLRGEIGKAARSIMASEGENVALDFSNRAGELGRAVREVAEKKYPLIVLLDAIDSGASIDRARELRSFFDMIYEYDISKGVEVYIVMAVNHYELAKFPADCVNVRTGEHIQFKAYDAYARFICSFEGKFKRF